MSSSAGATVMLRMADRSEVVARGAVPGDLGALEAAMAGGGATGRARSNSTRKNRPPGIGGRRSS